MWSKKWYLKRYILCDAHLLNELLETDVPWDDALVVSADKLRKMWDSLSELRRSLFERWLERTVLRPALLPVKTAQFTKFFRQVWRHSKIAQFNCQCIGRYTPVDGTDKYASHWVQRCIHIVIMIYEVRPALRTAINRFTNIISRLLISTEDAVCFITTFKQMRLWSTEYTGLSKKMDGIWNRYNLKSTGRIYTFGVLKCSEKFKVLDLP